MTFKKFKRRSNSGRNFGFGAPGYNRGLGGLGGDQFGFNRYLEEIGRFNPIFCEPVLQRLMERSVMPRLGLILLGSAMAERQYVVSGADPEVEAFYQNCIDYIAPKIVKSAPRGIWFGVQGYILEWEKIDGKWIPTEANDLDPFDFEILEDEDTNAFRGIRANGTDYGLDQAVKITWQGYNNNHYGTPQALTVYPYWWAHSAALVWTLRYYERSVDPVRLGFARAKSLEIEDGETVDLSELVVELLDALDGGDAGVLPLPDSPDEPDYARVETLDLPDRSDTFLKLLTYLEQKILLSTLSMPGIGVSSAYGDMSGGDAKTSEKTQIRVLEHCTEPVVEVLNQIIKQIHKANNFPGLPPRVSGGSFKRDQEEKLLSLYKDALKEPIVDPTDPSKAYRNIDLVKWPSVAKSLSLPMNDVPEISELWAVISERMESVTPDPVGRPKSHAVNPEIDSGIENGHESRPEERLDGKERAR